MGGWQSARPSIERKLKQLGFKDTDLGFIWQASPEDRKKLTENVDKLIQKKKDKKTQIKGAISESFPWYK
jgi:hypothetical protein